jgi:hypothetical protein
VKTERLGQHCLEDVLYEIAMHFASLTHQFSQSVNVVLKSFAVVPITAIGVGVIFAHDESVPTRQCAICISVTYFTQNAGISYGLQFACSPLEPRSTG